MLNIITGYVKIHKWIFFFLNKKQTSKQTITHEFIAEHILPQLRGGTNLFAAWYSRSEYKWGRRHTDTRHMNRFSVYVQVLRPLET